MSVGTTMTSLYAFMLVAFQVVESLPTPRCNNKVPVKTINVSMIYVSQNIFSLGQYGICAFMICNKQDSDY